MKAEPFRLRIEHLWGLAVLVGIFVFVSTHPIRPQDFWWHITIGREVATTGQIPSVDIYSYTAAGQSYPSYKMSWLMDSVLYGLYHLGGAPLVIFAHSLWITAAYAIVFWICLQVSRSWRIAALCVFLAAALGLNDWNVRPQGITFLLASLVLLALHKYRKQQRIGWLVLIPASMLVWVNSHGTFVIGLALLGIWFGQEIWDALVRAVKGGGLGAFRRLLVPTCVLILAALVCLVNPRGAGIIDYVRTLTSNSVVQNLVTEWAPPTLHTYLGIAFFCSLLVFTLVLLFSPKRPDFYQVATLIAFGILSVRTSRGIVWFGLVMAPVIAEQLPALVRRWQKVPAKTTPQKASQFINLAFVVVLAAMAVVSLPWFKSALPLPSAKAGLVSSETPLQATQVLLEKNPAGRLFNSMSFGSYLIWAAYPQYQVFVDTRIELFPEAVWMDYLRISNAMGDWETSLDRYGVNTLLLSPVEQASLINAVLASGKWVLLYQDDAAYLFGRK